MGFKETLSTIGNFLKEGIKEGIEALKNSDFDFSVNNDEAISKVNASIHAKESGIGGSLNVEKEGYNKAKISGNLSNKKL